MVNKHEFVQNQRGVGDNAPSSPKLPSGLVSPVASAPFLPCLVGWRSSECCSQCEAAHWPCGELRLM